LSEAEGGAQVDIQLSLPILLAKPVGTMDVVDDGRRAYERVDSTHGGSCCFDSLAGGIPVTEVKRQEFNLVVFRVRPPGEACVDRGDAAAMSEQVLDD
jgi:hypothetical protein